MKFFDSLKMRCLYLGKIICGGQADAFNGARRDANVRQAGLIPHPAVACIGGCEVFRSRRWHLLTSLSLAAQGSHHAVHDTGHGPCVICGKTPDAREP